MEFYLLGPVRAAHDGVDLFIGGEKQRTVLASLLLHDKQVLNNDRLTQLLWEYQPPTTANAQIHTYMSRLRIKLRPHVSIVRRHQGYLLQTHDHRVDYKEFSRLADTAHAALTSGRFQEARDGFNAALALWHPPALSDVTQFLADKVRPAWEELRMAALEGRINAELNLNMHTSLVPELTGLVREYPYRETLRVYLMTALNHNDRQADALAVYHDGRRILMDEVGVDPSDTLVQTYLAVLRHQPVPVMLPQVLS
jgi:DNA-binding SARP family transcriptional activator